MELSQLETPCLILDKGKMQRNIRAMHAHLSGHGVAMRPHGKTTKCIEAVRHTLEGGPCRLTVSTLKEAEYFFAQGIRDLVYAVGIAPVKLDRLARLRRQGADISVVLDSVEQARFVAAHGRKAGVTFPALIELDSDGHRSGVRPGDSALIEIGRVLQDEKGAELRGVLTHAGGSYSSKSAEEIRAAARQERAAAVACAEALRQAGLPCPVVSIGSTPTARYGEDFSGVTEVRCGVFVLFDLFMAGLGVCRVEDIAVSVLATIIGHQKQKGWLITDAGWMAMSRDRGTANQRVDQGYGLVCRTDGTPYDDLIVSAANQEHGTISRRQGGPLNYDEFPIGSTVRILPNHACAVGGMHEKYHVVDGGTTITDVWQRINGW